MMITTGRSILCVNQKLCDVGGYLKAELVDKPTYTVYALKEEYLNVGYLLQAHDEFTTKAHLKRKDGSSVLCSIKVTKHEKENYISVYFKGILEAP